MAFVTVSVASSDVVSIGYESETQTMVVTFVKTGPYIYFDVPPDFVVEFLESKSKGQFVNDVLRNEGFDYTRG